MSRKPRLFVNPGTYQGAPAITIARGNLATLKVRMDEAIDLANAITDLVEEGEADGVPTMR